MKDKPDQWSDAELAFGALEFGDGGGDSFDAYVKCYNAFTSAFHRYLKMENERFAVASDSQKGLATQFLRRILNIDAFMTGECSAVFQKRLENIPLSIQFITFNYTDTIEKILDVSNGTEHEFEFERRPGQAIKVSVADVLHAHGTLRDSYVFGVDDPSQIADEKVREACKRRGGMLKGVSVETLGIQDRKNAMKALRKSELLVTYGLSFGETDHSWWTTVYEIFRNHGVPIVVCPYAPNALTEGRSVRSRTAFYDQEKKRLFATLIKRTPTLLPEIESIKVPRITVLAPAMVDEGHGNSYKCDYFGLHGIGEKCIGKGSVV